MTSTNRAAGKLHYGTEGDSRTLCGRVIRNGGVRGPLAVTPDPGRVTCGLCKSSPRFTGQP
jgi:hypothetical protein